MLGWLFDKDYFKRETEEYVERRLRQMKKKLQKPEEPKAPEPEVVAEEVSPKQVISQYPTFAEAFPEIAKKYEDKLVKRVREVKVYNAQFKVLTDAHKDIPKRSECSDLKKIDNAPRVVRVLSNKLYISDRDSVVEYGYSEFGELYVREFILKPPMFRLLLDLLDNFCSWTCSWVNEIERDCDVKGIVGKKLLINDKRYVFKDGIVIEWNNCPYHYYHYRSGKLKVGEVEMEINREEVYALSCVVSKCYNDILLEEKEDKARQEELKRLALDEVVKGILSMGK